MYLNPEHLSSLLCHVIQGAIETRDDATAAAEKAAKAYAAGLAAFDASAKAAIHYGGAGATSEQAGSQLPMAKAETIAPASAEPQQAQP